MITQSKFSRRAFGGLSLAVTARVLLPRLGNAEPKSSDWNNLGAQFQEIERKSLGRLGVGVIDVAKNAETGYRMDELFPLCSTFKLLAASAILKRVDEGRDALDTLVKYGSDEVVTYSPRTKDHAGEEGMVLSDICEAAMTLSDNTAGNLMLKRLGGPGGVTEFARSIGDSVSRLDRTETSLNKSIPGDPRDTTSPIAMARDINALLFGNVLSEKSKAQLRDWLLANKTSDKRFRAGVPADWRVGDKTGTGDRGSTNDVGVFWPPHRPPIVVAVYLTNTTASPNACSATIVDVVRAVRAAFDS